MNHKARTQSLSFVSDRALHIALVEDNRQLRGLLTTALHGEGHMVEELADGAELLEYLATLIVEGREDEVDLIISEQDLPGIPGLSLLAGLRARGHEVPFVLMTGNGVVQAHAAELRGAILDRPFNLGAIRASLHRAVAEVLAHDFEVPAPANDVRVREGHS